MQTIILVHGLSRYCRSRSDRDFSVQRRRPEAPSGGFIGDRGGAALELLARHPDQDSRPGIAGRLKDPSASEIDLQRLIGGVELARCQVIQNLLDDLLCAGKLPLQMGQFRQSGQWIDRAVCLLQGAMVFERFLVGCGCLIETAERGQRIPQARQCVADLAAVTQFLGKLQPTREDFERSFLFAEEVMQQT